MGDNQNVGQSQQKTNWLNFQQSLDDATDTISSTAKTLGVEDVDKNAQFQSSVNQITGQFAQVQQFIASAPVLFPPSDKDPQDGNNAFNQLGGPGSLGNAFLLGTTNALNGSTTDNSTQTQAGDSTVTDPEVIAAANQRGVAPGDLDRTIKQEGNERLEAALNKLPPDEANKLRMALGSPEGAKNLSPELKAKLEQLQKDNTQATKEEYGFSDQWQGESFSRLKFKEKVTEDYDTSFEHALKQAAQALPLSEEQVLLLKAKHYSGDADKRVLDPALKTAFENIEKQATDEARLKYGFDEDWKPSSDTQYFSSVLNGAFLASFNQALQSAQPPLTSSEMAILKDNLVKFIANKNDPSIPDSVKTQLTGLVGTANAAVISKYNLDPTWTSSIKTLSPPGINPADIDTALGSLAVAQEMMTTAQNVAAGMPDSPEKANFLHFLQLIGKALNLLQESIYAMAGSQTEVSKALNRAKLDTQVENLAKQQRADEEAKSQGGKFKGLGPFSDIMEVMSKVMIVGFSCLFPPIGPAMAIAWVVKSDVYNPAFKGVASGCQAFGEALDGIPFLNHISPINGKQFGAILGSVVNIHLAMILSAGNPMLAMELATKNTKATENVAASFGADEQQQAIAAAVVAGVAQIAMAVAMAAMTAGAAGPGVLKSVLTAMKVADETQKKIQLATAIMVAIFTVTIAGLQGTQQYADYENNMVHVAISKIKSKMEAETEEVQALIAILKQLVDKLLSSLQGNTDWILDISTLQGSKYTQASQIVGELFG